MTTPGVRRRRKRTLAVPMKTIARLLAVLLPIAVSGCLGWKPVRTLPSAEQEPISLRAARLTTTHDASPIRGPTVVVLRDVQITADSVIGWQNGAADRVAIRRSQVRGIESRALDRWRTAGVATLVVLGAYAGVLWYALAGSDF